MELDIVAVSGIREWCDDLSGIVPGYARACATLLVLGVAWTAVSDWSGSAFGGYGDPPNCDSQEKLKDTPCASRTDMECDPDQTYQGCNKAGSSALHFKICGVEAGDSAPKCKSTPCVRRNHDTVVDKGGSLLQTCLPPTD